MPLIAQLPKLDPNASPLPEAAARQTNSDLIFLQGTCALAALMMNK